MFRLYSKSTKKTTTIVSFGCTPKACQDVYTNITFCS